MRYEVYRIADAECHLSDDLLAATDDAGQAKTAAEKTAYDHYYGTGILDTQTGLIDIGFGFGATCANH